MSVEAKYLQEMISMMLRLASLGLVLLIWAALMFALLQIEEPIFEKPNESGESSLSYVGRHGYCYPDPGNPDHGHLICPYAGEK